LIVGMSDNEDLVSGERAQRIFDIRSTGLTAGEAAARPVRVRTRHRRPGQGWLEQPESANRPACWPLPTRDVRLFGSWSSSLEEAPGGVDVRAAGERSDCG